MWELFTESQISELKRLGFEFRGHTDNPAIILNDFSISIMADSINRDESKETLTFLVWLVNFIWTVIYKTAAVSMVTVLLLCIPLKERDYKKEHLWNFK